LLSWNLLGWEFNFNVSSISKRLQLQLFTMNISTKKYINSTLLIIFLFFFKKPIKGSSKKFKLLMEALAVAEEMIELQRYANRDKPVRVSGGTFVIVENGNIKVYDSGRKSYWGTNLKYIITARRQ